jgi:transcription elongation factor GreA
VKKQAWTLLNKPDVTPKNCELQMDTFLMTPLGHQKLEKKLQKLRNIERYKIVKDIEEARAHGDISENSEYEDAKERQAMCEGMIQDLEAKLSRSQVIDVTSLDGANLPDDSDEKSVVFGSTVTVEDPDGDEHTFRIVGTDESDITKGWISYQTPVAKALLGRSPGDDVSIVLPSMTKEYEILTVSYE